MVVMPWIADMQSQLLVNAVHIRSLVLLSIQIGASQPVLIPPTLIKICTWSERLLIFCHILPEQKVTTWHML